METNIVKLKNDFNNIIVIRNSVKNVFDILQSRIDKLKFFYSEFIKNDKNDMFVFGLDSFHFQSKLIDIEYDDMKRLFIAINNRMYCEYFKLNKIIIDYILKNVNDKKIVDVVKVNNYPIYKDLEPFKEYKFEVILDIHENILNLLAIILSVLTQKENELLNHKIKQSIGLNIDNYITTFNYNNTVIREKISMFISYIEFFHRMHTKYLKRFSNKIQLIYTHINTDIKFDDSIESPKDKKEVNDDASVESNKDTKQKPLKKTLSTESLFTNEVKESFLNVSTESNLNTLNSVNSGNFIEDSDSVSSSASVSSVLRSSSFGQFASSSPNTSGFKTSIKRNVTKLKSNVMQLFKQKEVTIDMPIIPNAEVDNMFTNIELSCDTIINTEPVINDPVKTVIDVPVIDDPVIDDPVKTVIDVPVKTVIDDPVKTVIDEIVEIVEPIVNEIVEPIVNVPVIDVQVINEIEDDIKEDATVETNTDTEQHENINNKQNKKRNGKKKK
jgi:hypothetical protein